jgi:hypothetical protein
VVELSTHAYRLFDHLLDAEARVEHLPARGNKLI